MAMTGGESVELIKGSAGGNSNLPITLYLYYKTSQDAAANKSTITMGMYVTTPSSGYDIGPWGDYGGSYIGTTSKTFDGSIPNFKGTRWLVENKSMTVTHDDDGNATATIYWKWGVNSPWGQMTKPSGSFTITLPQIKRASELESVAKPTPSQPETPDEPETPGSSTATVANATLGSTTKIVWTPTSKSYYYKVKMTIGSESKYTDVIHPNTTLPYTINLALPYSWAEQIASNKTTGTVTVTLYTYSDSAGKKQVGTADTKTFTVSIPNNSSTKPDVTLSVAPVNTDGVAWKNLYVQGISQAKPTISATGRYGATISSKYMTLDGRKYTTSPYTSNVLSEDGERVMYAYATDSRGFTRSVSKKITVIPYAKPTIKACSGETNVVCDRCDSSGNLSDDGKYLRIKALRSYSKIMSGGTQHNYCSFKYRWKKAGGTYSSWITALEKTKTSTNTVDLTLSNICTDVTSSYYVQLLVEDDVGKYTQTTYMVPTTSVDFNLRDGGGGAAFGCYAEEKNVLAIADNWNLKVYGDRWKSLGISSNATTPDITTYSFGRATPGTCSYRVENGNHVYVQINCGFTWAGDSIVVSDVAIPSAYRPPRDIFSYCATGGKYIVKLAVSSLGKVVVSNVQDMSASTHSDSATINWIDGYIDYFI